MDPKLDHTVQDLAATKRCAGRALAACGSLATLAVPSFGPVTLLGIR
jgi:hypothetical protein